MSSSVQTVTETLTSPIYQLVQQQFQNGGHSRLRALDVQEEESEVVLTGRVPTFYLKQMAQSLARPVVGSKRLINRIIVESC